MQKNPLIQFGNVPITVSTLRSCFTDLDAPQKKIIALEKAGEIIRLKRNLYVVNAELSGKPISIPLCANHIYGPSYVSSRWALQWYGLIPERIYRVDSMTTKHSRCFETPLGVFDFHQITPDYHSVGVNVVQDGDVSYLMASPEKALCDMILLDMYVPNRSVVRLEQYLREDVRLDMDEFMKFDIDILKLCAEFGGKKTIFNNLIKILKQ
ncbi:MAG: hypothetical protein IJ057_00370 [Bacteroidales bacterium]|nr:hypothetical protein [Bacteroidales bacterium]